MAERLLPRYPVYIPSKGRAELKMSTARRLMADEVPFLIVIEPSELEAYAKHYPRENLLVTPHHDIGAVPTRNFIKDHSIAAGASRHWQIDDNISYFWRRWQARRIRVDAGIALRATEDFVDRYENVAIAGLQYDMFAPDLVNTKPFVLNGRVYSCSLILNSTPNRWRGVNADGETNEDTDMCLQLLADGWCTVLVNVFLIKKIITMQTRGGNTEKVYKVQDGRLRMARGLERLWPGVVTTKRRFQRPQHVVFDSWKRFDTPLKLKPGIDLAALKPNEYGMELRELTPVESPRLKKLVKNWNAEHPQRSKQ